MAGHEGFGPDYVLPNDGYLETCAAIGAGFFHQNMNLAFADARYADELERVLYNGVLSGVSLKGDSYFYENPLEAGKKRTRWSLTDAGKQYGMYFDVNKQNNDGVPVQQIKWREEVLALLGGRNGSQRSLTFED